MRVQHFHDPASSTITYVVFDEASRIGVVIDPVLDWDPRAARTGTHSAEQIAAFIDEQGLSIPYVLDTHAHADHATAMPFFRERYGAKGVIGATITEVQASLAPLYGLGDSLPQDGRQWDVLIRDGERLELGPFAIVAHHTPGHTPACHSYQIGDMIFVGDVIFMPDFGTARCDFPGGSADALYDSIRKLYGFPDDTRLFTCHDYQPGGRELRFVATVGEQKAHNKQLRADTTREEFVRWRSARDATLKLPAQMVAVMQLNLRAGERPPPREDGVSYLVLPLDRF